jgi:predicted aspartyl protease
VRRRSPTALLGAVIAFCLSSACLASENASEELIARHVRALGGEEAVRAIGTMESTADIELLGTGLKGTVHSWTARPCLSYTEISLGFLKVKEGYDGERIWSVDPNGKLQFRRDSTSLEYEKTMCLLESQDYLFGGEDFECAAAGPDTVNGVPCEVLDIRAQGGASAKVYLNDSTYLVERIDIKAPEGNTVQTFGDYRPVAGVMFPFAARTEIAALGQKIEMRYRSIEANVTIDPVVFLPPSADVKDFSFSGGAFREEVPFIYRSRHVFLPVRLTGADGELLFLVDSGASMTVIDSSLAADMRLPVGGKMPGAGAGGMADFSLTHVPGFSIAGIKFSGQTAITFPVAGLMRTFEETEIGGILGYDFLSRFVTTIDYERERITFFDPDSFAYRPGEEALEAPLVHNVFSLPVSIDGMEGAFLLDTGANSSLIMGSFAEKTGLATGRRTLTTAIRGAGGDERAVLCRFDSLRIGRTTLAKPVLLITSSAQGISALESVNGIIGNDILERFMVTLDYGRQRVLLVPNGRIGDPFYRDRSGLQLARREDRSIVVVTLVPGSPADEAGLRPGDILIALDGRKASEFESVRDIMKLFEASEGTEYRIDISRSKNPMQVALRLANYI